MEHSKQNLWLRRDQDKVANMLFFQEFFLCRDDLIQGKGLVQHRL